MSNSIYLKTALGIGLLIGAVIALVVMYRFVCWLGLALWTQSLLLIEYLYGTLVRASCAIGAYIKGVVISLLTLVWSLFLTLALKLAQPIQTRLIACLEVMAVQLKLRQLYWKHGHRDFKSFEAFKRYMLGEEEPDQEPKPSPKRTSYSEAQAVLGFSGDEPSTPTDLKVRYRKMISYFHSDIGFPTDVFAQQINDAVGVIKKVKKWI